MKKHMKYCRHADKKEIRYLQYVIKKMAKDRTTHKETIKKLSTVIEAQKNDIDHLNHTVQNQQKELKSVSNYNDIYKLALERFTNQGGNDDIARIKQLRVEFKQWESYFLKLYQTFDDLHYELMEIIEQDSYLLNKEKRLMAFPIVFKDRRKNIDNFKTLIEAVTNALTKETFIEELPDNLLSITGVNVRTSSDLDYFFHCSEDLHKVQSFIKQSMNTILLVLKVLLKSKDMILKLMNDTIEMKDVIFKKIAFFDAFELSELIAKKDFKGTSGEITKAIDLFLQENYKTARQTEELVDGFRKQYFSVLNRSIIKVYNDLMMGAANFASTAKSYESHSDFLDEWQTIYFRQAEVILSYMEEHLSITKIECAKGDHYNDERHKPFDKSEKDDNLKTDMIKSVINDGFIMTDNQKQFVIKPVDVIVVNNH